MKRNHLAILAGALAIGCMAWSRSALADGVLMGPGALPAAERAVLMAQVRDARAANPSSFERLAAAAARLPGLDAQKRGRYPAVVPMLRALGADALLPMLEAIALDAPSRGRVSDEGWTAWRAGLVETVGALRDARSAPVLEALLDGPNADFMIVQAAAGAYGKLETDAVAARLIGLSRAGGAKQSAVLSGLGHCRRVAVAQRLAEVLGSASDEATVRLAAHALGDIGSAWAWSTPQVTHPQEQDAVRETAARALIAAVARHRGETRGKLISAVLVVDHAATLSMIEAHKQGAGPDAKAGLDELARRFASSPFRR